MVEISTLLFFMYRVYMSSWFHTGDQVKKTEMGRIYSTYGEKKAHTGF